MLAGTSIREKVTPCPENRPAADKFQKGKRPLVDRTISPKAKFFVYFRSELPGDRSPKQAQSWRWQSRNDDSPYLDPDAGLEAPHAVRTVQAYPPHARLPGVHTNRWSNSIRIT
jgi:hypothetical protein